MKRLALLLIGLAGCQPAVTAHFRDQPVVARSDDRHAIAMPAERSYESLPYMADALAFDPIVDALDPPRPTAAGDTNALDEVPDSTWFENRIGVRTISPDEAARGPDIEGPPQPPYTITRAKGGGNNPGFVMRDGRGVRYLVKFDTAENPEQQTGTNVIVNRIFWTIGYHVPADHVFYFTRRELILPPDTAAKYHLSEHDIDRMLIAATHRGDQVRATASQFLDGNPRGGWPRTGTRDDDANDRVPHEQRRVLRGLRLFAAWLGHTDMKEDNTLDMYVGEPGAGYLVHYLVDFGEAMGGHQSEKGQLQIGWEYGWDWGNQLRALASFGLWKRPWEDQAATRWRSIGYFGAGHFDPRQWRERYPYAPFAEMDRADAYWATRLIMRFDRPMLEAIVAKAQFSEPGAATYLVDTLMARRDKIGIAYLDAVTPLDDLTIRPGQLCAVDLGHAYGLREGEVVIGDHGYREEADGQVCLPTSFVPGYHILRAHVRSARGETPPIEIHYMGGPTPRILGIVR